MRFALSNDQTEIAAAARDLLARDSAPARMRTHAEAGTTDVELWQAVGELGWPGVAVAERHGGLGMGMVELSVLLEELGASTACVPVLGTTLAALAIEESGTDKQRELWLPRLAEGSACGAFGELAGSRGHVIPDAGGADVVVSISADAGEAWLVEADGVEQVETIDPTRRYGRISKTGTALAGPVPASVDRALVAMAADLVGVSRRALEISGDYVKDRRQFDVPVGGFQAVSHRLVDMWVGVETARAAVLAAAWAADHRPAELPAAAALAKAWASTTATAATGSAIQALGGIGFTWEADVHWLYKRAQLGAEFLGGASRQRCRLSRLVLGA